MPDLFSIMIDDTVHLAGSLVVNGMSVSAATQLIEPLTSGGIVAAGILSELVDLGVILLAVSALRVGVPRWTSAVVIVGAVAQAAGFSSASRYLAAAGFALVVIGFAAVVRAVAAQDRATADTALDVPAARMSRPTPTA